MAGLSRHRDGVADAARVAQHPAVAVEHREVGHDAAVGEGHAGQLLMRAQRLVVDHLARSKPKPSS